MLFLLFLFGISVISVHMIQKPAQSLWTKYPNSRRGVPVLLTLLLVGLNYIPAAGPGAAASSRSLGGWSCGPLQCFSREDVPLEASRARCSLCLAASPEILFFALSLVLVVGFLDGFRTRPYKNPQSSRDNPKIGPPQSFRPRAVGDSDSRARRVHRPRGRSEARRRDGGRPVAGRFLGPCSSPVVPGPFVFWGRVPVLK